MNDHNDVKPTNKVPVTILTGHLGAGKTTLLRRILRNDLGLRIAVIENEFGNEIGIERLLANTSLDPTFGESLSEEQNDVFVKSQADLFVELSNGCVCCSVKDTLVNTLETLLS
jgi:G3E family GTPase